MKRLACCAVVVVAGCAVTGPGDEPGVEQAASSTQYVDILDFQHTDQGAWYDLVGKLNTEFSAEHGASITPLRLFCSVTSKLGSVKDCAWTFAAAQHAVDGTTAAYDVDAVTYRCHFHPKTTATKLVATLSASANALHESLPGMTSIADALPDCFANPEGGTPLAAGAGTTYVDADAYYTSAAYAQKWTDAKAALVLGFNNVCGDTFCGSDYSDLQSLDLGCSVTRSSGNVKACDWSFGGSFATVATTGLLDVTARTWTCPVAVKGTLSQVITTLTATGTDDPIQRALPGGTSAYDSIAGCVAR
jgi:hypothetical protein